MKRKQLKKTLQTHIKTTVKEALAGDEKALRNLGAFVLIFEDCAYEARINEARVRRALAEKGQK